jgi:hypothetical protein
MAYPEDFETGAAKMPSGLRADNDFILTRRDGGLPAPRLST